MEIKQGKERKQEFGRERYKNLTEDEKQKSEGKEKCFLIKNWLIFFIFWLPVVR